MLAPSAIRDIVRVSIRHQTRGMPQRIESLIEQLCVERYVGLYPVDALDCMVHDFRDRFMAATARWAAR